MARPARPAVTRAIALVTCLACLCVACVVPRGPGAGEPAIPACPRDAAIDPTGRCACAPDTYLVLGACLPPATADAFCGPAGRATADGCVLRSCSPSTMLDLASGACVPRAPRSPVAPPASGDATCPRGTRRKAASCLRPPSCPPGTLPEPEGSACRVVVSQGPSADRPRVDVGAWASLALGADGGAGSSDLCRPLQQAAAVTGVPAGSAVRLAVRLTFPDQDVTAVTARLGAPVPAHGPVGEDRASAALAPLVEALRALGGEATAASVELTVTCPLEAGVAP